MAANTPTAFADPARLRSAPWLRTPAIRRVFDVLATTGAVSRAVGGAVRNTLLGQAISDVDIATAATPDQVRAAAARAGLDAIPTGLAHGTVTLVSDGVPFEVTTLRRDVATDGRHATVAFTDNWVADASRRDFTINALYCDADGTLFDPLGGAADLTPPRVRFIGDPHARIREDALRILRFFRFSAEYAQREPDGALGFETIAFDVVGLAACRARTGDLAGLSAERVRAELMKILVAPGAAGAIDAMPADGLLAAVLGTAPQGDAFLRLTGLEAALKRPPDAVLRLAALAVRGRGDVTVLKRRLRLFTAEAARLAAACGPAMPDPSHKTLADGPAARRLQYRLGDRKSVV